MERKSFKITVNGETFNVEVEELITKKDVVSHKNEKVESKPVIPTTAYEDKNTYVPQKGVKQTKQEGPKEPSSSGGTVISAPMPGAIISVKVKEGDAVSNNDVLIILEAMKMENEITSPVSGKVSQVNVKKGDAVNSKDPLITITIE